MKRLFAFGCSYTSYSWPSWADLLSIDYDEFYNWGLPGIGNRAIAERVAEAHIKHNITKDDVVIVQWSTHLRNDWWHQEKILDRMIGWKTYGSIFNYHNQKLYDKKWIDTFFYEPAFLMHTFNHIVLVQQMLESTGCNWFMTSIGDIRQLGSDLRDSPTHGEVTDIASSHKNVTTTVAWDLIPELKIYDSIWNSYTDKWLTPFNIFCQSYVSLTYDFVDADGETYYEYHPSVDQYILWLTNELNSKLEISDKTKDIAESVALQVSKLHTKFKYNKEAFSVAIASTPNFPAEFVNKTSWPAIPLGF